MLNSKIIDFRRIRHTIGWTIVNFKTQECYDLYFQLSLKKPWLIPHYEREVGKTKMPLYGWLFFYFGRFTRGIVYPIKEEDISDKKKLLFDRRNHTYALCTISDRQVADNVRKAIKGKCFYFDVKKENKETTILARPKCISWF